MILLNLLLVSFHALGADKASECSTVNLTADNQIYNGIPTYDQGGGQICFAYTASQLIEGQRVMGGHKYKKEDAINPLSIALSLAIANGQTDIQQGGVACQAVNHARKSPACPNSKSFSDASEIEELINEFKSCQKNPSTANCKKDIFKQPNPLLYVKSVEDSKCKDSDKIVLKIPECRYQQDESLPSTAFKKDVDDVFNSKNPRPVEIGYSMNLLTYSGIEKKSYIIKREVEPDVFLFSIRYKPHSSILLGRKMGKNGQCQYLLRNTQGKAFCPSGIAKQLGWECDTKSEGIWINAKELFDSVFQVSSVADSSLGTMVKDLKNINSNPCTICKP